MEGTPNQTARVLVVGCGAIGGSVLARLVRAGRCAAVGTTTNAAIADRLRADGLRVDGVDGAFVAPVAADQVWLDVPGAPPPEGPFDAVILATQPPQVEEAARRVVGSLAPDGRIVVLQNGLCEERLARWAGADRVVGGVVAWGASMTEDGVYTRTSTGGFVLGRLDGDTSEPALTRLAELLSAVGPTTITGNLRGARWSKLAINCAISTLGTIGGDRLGALMRHAFVRRTALHVMTEVVQTARAEGVRLEKVAGTLDLDWLAIPDGVGVAGWAVRHAALLAVGTRYRNLRSSMLAAIERGRPPSVDFLNGEVVARAEAHGVPVPFNVAATEAVHRLARGEARPSLNTLRAMAAALGVSSA